MAAALVVAVALSLGTAGARAAAGAPPFDQKQALAYSQAAIGNVLPDAVLTDSRGQPFTLADMAGKPLVISLIYSSCYHTCPMLTQTLAHAVDVARDALGQQSFRVLSIGFDTRVDTPRRMAAFARAQGVDVPDWRFASVDAATMDKLARTLGFIFYPSAKGFDHLAQTTVVDANARVFRQIYGAKYAPPTLVEPLKALIFGVPAQAANLSGLLSRVRLFCTIYDPKSGRYYFDYSLIIAVVMGLLSLGATGYFLVREWRRKGQYGTG